MITVRASQWSASPSPVLLPRSVLTPTVYHAAIAQTHTMYWAFYRQNDGRTITHFHSQAFSTAAQSSAVDSARCYNTSAIRGLSYQAYHKCIDCINSLQGYFLCTCNQQSQRVLVQSRFRSHAATDSTRHTRTAVHHTCSESHTHN